jgi:TolB-like protein
VLYFEDGGDGSLRGLARGLTEDLIDALAAVSGLTVTSRNGVRPYEGKPTAPEVVGRALNVGWLVDGTVARAGTNRDSVRLTVRVIDARTGVQVERENVTRGPADPMVLRRELTALAEMSLRRRIGHHVRLRQERLAAGSDAAWELLRRARELREDARELEPDAALRRYEVVDSLLGRAELGGRWADPILERASLALTMATVVHAVPDAPAPAPPGADLILRRGIGHATRVLTLSPRHPLALAYRGDLLLRLWQWGGRSANVSALREARQDLLEATTLDPGLARAWYVLTEVHQALGENEEARISARRALAADIYAADAIAVISRYFFSALSESSRPVADSLCRLGKLHFPRDPNFQECEFTVIGWLGTDRRAVAAADSMLRLLDTQPALRPFENYRHLLYTALVARAGLQDSARRHMDRVLAKARREGEAAGLEVYQAYIELSLGNHGRSLDLLHEIVAADTGARLGLAVNPWFRPLQADPRFRQLVSP